MGNWNGLTELFIEGNPHRPDAHNQAQHRIRPLLYLLWHCLVSWQRHNGFLIRQVARGSDCLFDNLTAGRPSSFLLGKSRIKKFPSMKFTTSLFEIQTPGLCLKSPFEFSEGCEPNHRRRAARCL